MIPDIQIRDYDYTLPDDRIARYPLASRDDSKLLLYEAGAQPCERSFRELPGLLPEGSIMVFNDTKVVPARMHFRKNTGALIEIFCLEPVDPVEYNTSFSSTVRCSWRCVIGNAKRWKGEILESEGPCAVRARLISRDGQTGVVEFSWEGGESFSSVLEQCGNVPIPPYLGRDTEPVDLERYQTLYARTKGSVAAPTAGLHFTDAVLSGIDGRGILRRNICLHVGAGTFLPVKSASISGHPMHREPFTVGIDLLRELRDNAGRKVTAVGTTSVRTLESLYYAGVKCIETGTPGDVGQWEPYGRDFDIPTEESIGALVRYLEDRGLDRLSMGTRIIIVPGFRFRLVDMLVTNFHQPQSTLILLVSAFVGGDWRRIYDFALENGFRFLSYGDSSLLYRR